MTYIIKYFFISVSKMSFQRHVSPQNSLESHVELLRNKIAQTHFAYLMQEETPSKLQQCQRIEDLILEFLCLVPHKKKFKSPAFAEILHRSVLNPDFTAYKAVFAFNFIEKYASNLISQPWRKEYRTINMFGGFYKHNISKIIPSSHVIFTLMGYKRNREDDTLVMYGPVDPDKLSRVSLDCLVASLECRIMTEIAEHVRGRMWWTWKEISDVRKDNICDVQTAVDMMEMKKSKGRSSLPVSCHSPTYGHSDAKLPSNCRTNRGDTVNVNQNFSYPLYYRQEIPTISYNHSPSVIRHRPSDEQKALQNDGIPTITNNRQQSTNTNPSSSSHLLDMKLLDPIVDKPPLNLVDLESKTAEDAKVATCSNGASVRPKIRNPTMQPPVDDKTSAANAVDSSWDYVYHVLERKGYTKDLGERGDLLDDKLQPNSINAKERIAKTLSMPARRTDWKKHKKSEEDGPLRTLNPKEKRTVDSQRIVEPRKTSESLVPSAMVNGVAKSNSGKSDRDDRFADASNERRRGWSCTTCTYLNDEGVEICEMCSRSKDVEPDHLISGGRECPTCTLVNDKNVENCTACQTSLKDSPTYI